MDLTNPIILKLLSYWTKQTVCFDWACEEGHLDVVQYLVSQNITTTRGFVIACEKSHIEIVKFLIEKRVYGSHDIGHPYQLLHNNVEHAKTVIDVMPDIMKYHALQRAAYTNNLRLCQLLCESGVTIDDTILSNAQSPKLIQYLIDQLSDPWDLLYELSGLKTGFALYSCFFSQYVPAYIPILLDDPRVYSKDLDPLIRVCRNEEMKNLLIVAQNKVDSFKYNKIKEEL